MALINRTKLATFAVAAVSFLTLGSTLASAADAPAKKDIWYKLCVDVPQPQAVKPGEKEPKPEDVKKVNVCLTEVDVRDNVTALLVGKIAIRQIAGQEKPQLLVMLPLNALLPPGAAARVDDKQPVKLTYSTCDQAGCHADGEVDAAFIAQMKAGKQIAYMGVDATGHPLTIPVPLEGFGKVFDGPAMPVEKFNEDQKKIAEVVQQRLTALRAQQAEAEKKAGEAAPKK
jgi:invasion protein IalB